MSTRTTTPNTGLAGITVAQTSVSTVGVEEIGLQYRGYSIQDLAKKCSNFEEVAYLLLYGELPNQDDLDAFIQKIIENRELPLSLRLLLEQIGKHAHPMDVLRTGCSALGAIEPEILPPLTTKYSETFQMNCAIRLLGAWNGILLYWYHYSTSGIRIKTKTNAPTMAEHFYELLFANYPEKKNEKSEVITTDMIKAFNTSLILYAEHDFNASTFAARVTASTLADYHSAVTSAIGTLKGPLHGGASEAAMELISAVNTEAAAEMKLKDMVANKRLIMGFGHRIYKDGDPRSNIIKEWALKLSQSKPEHQRLYQIAEYIEEWMQKEKGIHPNLDFYTSCVYKMCGIPTNFFTPVFAIARTTGWTAHIFEQRTHNKLIRPCGEYVGHSTKSFIPIENRKPSSSRL